MTYRTQPTLPYFSSVVKNVANPNVEVKKLVYIYLLNHAEQEPDLALLSINTIQKSLNDQNPQVRAMALRTMSGIRVPVISQIVSLAIKRGCSDMSPHVRKAAALAIPKCYRLDPATQPQLLEFISTLLGDKQYFVVGPAVTAFLEVCPERIDLVHKHYRGLVKKLVDMDEWGQLATLRLMMGYARKCFPRRTRKVRKNVEKSFYEDEGGDEEEGEETGEEVVVLDPDLELFLKACKPLLQSRNSAVIVAVVRCFLCLGTPEHIESAIGPLVALLRSPQDIRHVALYNIVSVALGHPQAFVKYATHFLVHSSDPRHIWRLKLEILTIIFPYCVLHVKGIILSELEHFSRGTDSDLVRESVRAIGRCAQNDTRTSTRCLRLLLKQISSPDGNLVAESLTVIRHLIQQDPQSHTKTVITLAKNLDTTTNPEARATIIWLVGEFAGQNPEDNIAPDVLRILAKGFADEPEAAKLQIVLLAAKVYIHHLERTRPSLNPPPKPPSPPLLQQPDEESGFRENVFAPPPFQPTPEDADPDQKPKDPIANLYNYILLLARYDTSYDLRDRARLYNSLLAIPSSTQLASLLLLAPKPVPQIPSPSEVRKGFLLGSASLVVGDLVGASGLRGYEPLPEWVKEGEEPDAKLRETESAPGWEVEKESASHRLMRAAAGAGAGAGAGERGTGLGKGKLGKEVNLDDWLDEEEESGSESESESQTETTESVSVSESLGKETESSTEGEDGDGDGDEEGGSETEEDEEEDESVSASEEDSNERGRLMG